MNKPSKRGYAKAGRCGRGHAMSGDNVGLRLSGPYAPQRYCKACCLIRALQARERKRNERAA